MVVPYSAERVAKFKTIAGRRWHARERYWTVPHAESTPSQMLTVFGGEPVEVDPALGAVSTFNYRTPSPVVPASVYDRLCAALQTRHYSRKTEQAYVHWVTRFANFHHGRHPLEMAESEINVFLTHLAVKAKVSASTQNQALSAILFLYRHVLGARWVTSARSFAPAGLSGCRWS